MELLVVVDTKCQVLELARSRVKMGTGGTSRLLVGVARGGVGAVSAGREADGGGIALRRRAKSTRLE